jgi:hypothetical protein
MGRAEDADAAEDLIEYRESAEAEGGIGRGTRERNAGQQDHTHQGCGS